MKKESVFTTGYVQPFPKLMQTGNAKQAFLAVSNDSAETLMRMGFTSTVSSDIAANGFWHLAVQSVAETHSEAFTVNNTLSDTVSFFAMGAVPIGINISGVVLTTPKKDDRLNFLKLYADKLRGQALSAANAVLFFGYKDTLMRLFIQSLTMTNDANIEDLTQVNIAGYGSHYSVNSFTYNEAQASTTSFTTADTPVISNESTAVATTNINKTISAASTSFSIKQLNLPGLLA